MLQELRQARYGHLLGLHILLLCAAGHNPTQIATFLLCSRSSVYRTVEAYCQGELTARWTAGEEAVAPERALWRWQRSLLALLKKVPRLFGWCRTRWTCAVLALQLQGQCGYAVSRETIRRTLHQLDYSWKRARPSGRDDDPQRVSKLARIRSLIERLPRKTALFFADELDIHLLAKIGYEWMPKGTQKEVPTPGTNQKHYLAGALNYQTGRMVHVTGEQNNRFLFLNLLKALDRVCPARHYERIYVVADHYKIHTSKVVKEWLKEHPRVELLWLPKYCPKTNPIERAFGDVHDKCTRNHQRKRLRDLVKDVLRHLQVNGPWCYKISTEVYYTPEITQAVAELEKEATLLAA